MSCKWIDFHWNYEDETIANCNWSTFDEQNREIDMEMLGISLDARRRIRIFR